MAPQNLGKNNKKSPPSRKGFHKSFSNLKFKNNMAKVTKKIEFQYRPDGDLDEYIGNEDAERIQKEYRKLRYNQVREFYFFIGKAIFGFEYRLKTTTNSGSQRFEFVGENDHEKYKAIDQWEEANPEKKSKLFEDFLSTREWEIEYKLAENGELSILKKDEKILVEFTNELISSTKDMSSRVWNGVSSDMYKGYIEYENITATLLGKNEIVETSFGEILKQNNISFSEIERNVIAGLMVTAQTQYEYTKDGQKRYAYEYCVRTEIDSYTCFSYVFDCNPSDSDIIQAIKNEK